MRLGIIGLGYWGPNILRNFASLSEIEFIRICDFNTDRLNKMKLQFPSIECTTDSHDITDASDIDIVAVVTPVESHYTLGKRALENKKHLFIEKPFTSTSDEAKELIDIAQKNNLKIMVDHTFLFTGAVKKIKDVIQNKTLGDIRYFDSTRINLGIVQNDVNVIWDLATHDFSVMDYILPERIIGVSALGMDFTKTPHKQIH